MFEGRYAVSEDGEVYSLNYRGSGKRKELVKNKHTLGYLRVTIDDKAVGVHTLVAKAFIPNPDNKPEVDHIDGDKKNNHVDNLRWVTHRENINYAMERRGNWFKTMKKRTTKLESHIAGKKVKRYKSIKAAADEFGAKYTTFAPLICRAIKHDWLCYGVRWRRVA